MNKKLKKIVTLILAMIMVLNFTAMSYAATKSDPDKCFVNTDGGNLNGRKEAGTEYPIICKYANGTQLSYSVDAGETKFDSQGREWMRVRGKTTTGSTMTSWVLAEYLRFESPYRTNTDILTVINPKAPDVG